MDNYIKHTIVGAKRVAAAAERNKGPILEVLKQELRAVTNPGLALEVSSGTGQHVAHIAPHFPDITFQPSEFDTAMFDSIRQFIQDDRLTNVKDPVFIDASRPSNEWGGGIFSPASLSAIININMMHISPWNATEGLFAGAGRLLCSGGRLLTYGPYAYNGVITPESNQAFNATLQKSNISWGLRDVHLQLEPLAAAHGISLLRKHSLPANNQLLVWEKKS